MIFSLVSCLLSASALAAAPLSSAKPAPVKGELLRYFQSVASGSLFTDARGRPDCDPDHGDERGSCLKFACATGAYSCSTEYYLKKAIELCKDQRDADCLGYMCKTGAFSCGTEYYLQKAAALCKNAYGRCVEFACSTGAYSCGTEYYLQKAVQLCQNVRSASCLKEMCATGAYSCGTEYYLQKAAENCR